MTRLITIAMLLMLMAFLPGCGGCRHNPDEDKTPEEIAKELLERKKKEAERAKPDFESKPFLASRPPAAPPEVGCFAKPGHWTSVALEDVVANHFDFVGELEMASTDNEGNTLPLTAMPFDLSICRDMALPKGQAKTLDSLLFIPPGSKNPSTTYHFNDGQGGR